jgi:hypothetical protein
MHFRQTGFCRLFLEKAPVNFVPSRLFAGIVASEEWWISVFRRNDSLFLRLGIVAQVNRVEQPVRSTALATVPGRRFFLETV